MLLAAQSAIDIALYDIVGKALNVPVYQLLGGKQREEVPCFATGAGPALGDDVKLLMARGWRVIRTAPMMPDGAGGFIGETDIFDPGASITLTAKWLTKVREECGSEIVLGLDYHHRLSVAETASFCQRMSPGTLDFLEDPILDESPEAYAALRKLTPVPFAVGEEFASKWQFVVTPAK